LITKYNWAIYTSLGLGVVGILSSFLSKVIDFLWMKFAWILSLIIPNIILGAVFYLLLFPIASFAKLFNKDELQLKNNKNSFFKALEGLREENLKKKQELLAKAEEIKDSTDFVKTANELKKLQNQWREIGPVPEKFRNEVYKQFKAACDHFFEKKRSQNDSKNKEFEDNLKKKEAICKQIEEIIKGDTIELEEVYNLLDDYADIGFVPRNAIKKIHNRYDEVTDKIIALEDLSDDQRSELKIHVQMSKLKNSPHSGQKIHRKEGAIKRKISTIENDIATWKTNMGFFAQSKNADQLKKDFEDKIEKAEQELEDLKKQLDVLKEI